MEFFVLPINIDYIEGFAFKDCIKLKNFYYYGNKEPTTNDSFSGCINLNVIYVTNSYQKNSFGNLKTKMIP